MIGYESFYGLTFEPFVNLPDPRFYFNSPQHALAREYLLHAARGARGLALLLGDVGTGKTTLSRRVLSELATAGGVQVGLLVLTHSEFTPAWFLQKIGILLGLDRPSLAIGELFTQVINRLFEIGRSGRKAVIIIDEANKLVAPECAEELRGLLNLELADGQRLVTFILAGLPPLNDFLMHNPALYQRIAVKVTLKPLSTDTVKAYVRHRLAVAGRDRELFTEHALESVAAFSGGRPRLVNVLCDNALVEGFLQRKAVLDEFVIERVATNLDLKTV